MSQTENGQAVVFIRQPEVLRRTALSLSTLYELIAKGKFPKPLKLGERINCWPEHEVADWQRAELESARAGTSASVR